MQPVFHTIERKNTTQKGIDRLSRKG